jgi:hypothetical protein
MISITPSVISSNTPVSRATTMADNQGELIDL